jgi:xylulokinase
MTMGAFAGVDIGTTGARALVIDDSGSIVVSASSEYPLSSPRPGWSEQDPNDWWAGAKKVLSRVGRDAQLDAIGLTGQMHGSVFLDEDHQPIRPALLWNDQRTSAQCDAITAAVGPQRLVAIAGNPALTGFQAPKILWLRDNEPTSYKRVRHVLLPKDFVRLRLSGELATDASDAAGTLLMDVGARKWSAEILDALEVPPEWLPQIYEGPDQTGVLPASVADDLGITPGIPIAAGGGDNAAAAVGTGIVETGRVSSSIGTSGVVFAHSDSFSPDPSGRLHAFCHAVPGRYHLMGVTLSAGASLKWWRTVLGSGGSYDDLGELAAQAPPGAEGLVFLPYLTGERSPHLDPHARGAFVGLTTRHGPAHMTRAVMEGVAFSLRDSLHIMAGLGIEIDHVRAIGGGARSDLWLQIQADVFGLPVRRMTIDEGPAYGAALLAGVTCGAFKDVAEASSTVRTTRDAIEPRRKLEGFYSDLYEVYRSLYSSLRNSMWELGDAVYAVPE